MLADLNVLQVGQTAFRGTKKLNLIQSVVFDAAYNSNENLLICAPTGAGKTNIAMLAVLRELKQHISEGVIKTDEFKVMSHFCHCGVFMKFIIYVGSLICCVLIDHFSSCHDIQHFVDSSLPQR